MACVVCAWGYNLARWVSQTINTVTGGDPRQTFSSRLGRAEAAGHSWAAAMCSVIGWFWRDRNHCRDAIRPGDNEMEAVDLDGPNDKP